MTPAGADVVRTARETAGGPEPLVVLDRLEAYLDAQGLGAGPAEAVAVGDGHSNLSYLVRRGDRRLVLRRPPRGPLPPSAHDVIREARVLRAVGAAGVRVPEVLAVCEDASVVGAPFFVMDYIDGRPLSELGWLFADDARPDCERLADELVDALIAIHAVDWRAPAIASLARPDGFLERQLRRFSALAASNATRDLPHLDAIRDWLVATMPAQSETTMVHGDYRGGNVLFAAARPPRLLAVLDWELATLGDPLADVGYLLATYAEERDDQDPMLALSAATTAPGFPTRRTLAEHYARRSGRDLAAVRWYMVLALYRSVTFLEGSYRRHLSGTTDDPFFASLEHGIPRLAERAYGLIHNASDDLSDGEG